MGTDFESGTLLTLDPEGTHRLAEGLCAAYHKYGQGGAGQE